MYVYTKTEYSLWTVGYYSPDGQFHPESDHDDPKEAAERVHYLNGGYESMRLEVLEDKLEKIIKILGK